MQSQLARMHVTLTVDSIPKTVEADSGKLLRVSRNPFNNALEAFDGQPGKIAVHVKIDSRTASI